MEGNQNGHQILNTLARTIEVLAGVASLIFFIGWLYLHAYLRYFGIDHGQLDIPFVDYFRYGLPINQLVEWFWWIVLVLFFGLLFAECWTSLRFLKPLRNMRPRTWWLVPTLAQVLATLSLLNIIVAHFNWLPIPHYEVPAYSIHLFAVIIALIYFLVIFFSKLRCGVVRLLKRICYTRVRILEVVLACTILVIGVASINMYGRRVAEQTIKGEHPGTRNVFLDEDPSAWNSNTKPDSTKSLILIIADSRAYYVTGLDTACKGNPPVYVIPRDGKTSVRTQRHN